jgi:hypothetical protein
MSIEQFEGVFVDVNACEIVVMLFLQVLLHPKGHIIHPNDIGLVISSDIHVAFAISKYGNKNATSQLCSSFLRGKALKAQYSHYQVSTEVESVINRWKRTGTVTTLNTNRDSVVLDPTIQDGDETLEDATSTKVGLNLESQLRSTINRNLVANEEANMLKSRPGPVDLEAFPGWLNKLYGVYVDVSPGSISV